MSLHAVSDSGMPRRNISRACDVCKRKKAKCDGQQPCWRCVSFGTDCQYRQADKRLHRRRSAVDEERPRHPSIPSNSADLALSSIADSLTPESVAAAPASADLKEGFTSRAQTQDRHGIEDHIGDTSTHAFLNRVCYHLNLLGEAEQRIRVREVVAVRHDNEPSCLFMPSRSEAESYIDCVFNHVNATYRYLSLKTMQTILDRIYSADGNVPQGENADFALLLSTMACGCVFFGPWKSIPITKLTSGPGSGSKVKMLMRAALSQLEKTPSTFPPPLATIQAHFAYCQALLGCRRYNSAWMMLGKSIRLGQMIGLGKTRHFVDSATAFLWKGLFWSMFMMDRYLSIILGRPPAIHDRYIAVSLPEAPDASLESQLGSAEAKLVAGTVAHIRLMMIANRIMEKLYISAEPESMEQVVPEMEGALETWAEQSPTFFRLEQQDVAESSDYFDIPWIFKRQQRIIRFAYLFTKLFLYRPFLLEAFLSHPPGKAISIMPSGLTLKCVEAAISMAKLAADLTENEVSTPVYWSTSHMVSCALAILVVSYPLCTNRAEELEVVVARALKAHFRMTHFVDSYMYKLYEVSKLIAQTVHLIGPNYTGSNRSSHSTVPGGVEPQGDPVPLNSIAPGLELPIEIPPRLVPGELAQISEGSTLPDSTLGDLFSSHPPEHMDMLFGNTVFPEMETTDFWTFDFR